ncbi:MAG: cache domain-containing protein [Deltaproteobacteria bacterium]|nr:cache domain-containing protein [Candidatus Anaeroferrophillacea bacterium]
MGGKSSFIRRIQAWGIIFLLGIGGGIILLDITGSYREFGERAAQMRRDYIARQQEQVQGEVERTVTMIRHEQRQAEELTKETIRARTREAHAVATHIHEQNRNAPPEEIRRLIVDALRPVRYAGGVGYYYAGRLADGVCVLFPDHPEREGTCLLKPKDSAQDPVIGDIIALARRDGEGFYTKRWSKPGETERKFRKISYIKRFDPLGWYIGTGLYADDVARSTEARILERISHIRFGTEGYIFVNRRNGDALVTSGRVIGGRKKLWDAFPDDPEKMKAIFRQELDAAAQPDGGFITYSLTKLTDPSRQSRKISFVVGIPEMEWLVGAGFYLDDVETAITALHRDLQHQITGKLTLAALITAAIVAIFLLFLRQLGRRLKNDFDLFVSWFSQAAQTDEPIDRKRVHFEELDHLAGFANGMLADRQTARDELAAERERLFVTIRSIGDAVITTDTTGRVELMNTVAEHLTGWTLGEAQGTPLNEIFRIINADSGAPAENPAARVLAGAGIIGLANHTVLIAKDGAERQIVDSAAPITDAAGTITGVVLVFRDVTDEYRMREELRRSEQFLGSIFSSIQDGISILNPDLTIRHTNDTMKRWYADRLPLEGKSCYACYQGRSRPCEPCPTLRALASGKTETAIVAGPADTPVKWIELYSYPIRDPDRGTVTGVVEFARDITSRREAEDRLRQSEANLRLVLETATNVAFIKTGTEGIDARIIDFSPGAAIIFGLPQAAAIGRRVAELHTPEDAARFPEVQQAMREHRRGFHGEITMVRHSGEHFPAFLTTNPIFDQNDEMIAVIGVAIDISEQKRAEEEQRTVEKLKSIGTLAGGIAHDFNNILMGLFGNLAIAHDTLAPDHPARRALAAAERSMNRATRLTNQLLTFARGGDPVKEDVSLAELVEEVVHFDLSGSNVRPVITTAADLWPAAADRGQIQQVISNLTINANQAMPDGGHLYVDLGNETIEATHTVPGLRPGRYLRLTFRDEGIGIDPKHRERIFDPYFSTKQEGNGLGLATTFSIVQKHGGHIQVESELGRGTVFTIHLPAAATVAARPEATARTAAASRLDGTRILVMDDDETVLEVVGAMLQNSGCTVAATADGAAARDRYRQALAAGTPFDLVIMDLTIPGGMGGREAAAQLLRMDPDARIIVSSGYSTDPVLANYRDYGFSGRLVKPFRMAELEKELARILRQE